MINELSTRKLLIHSYKHNGKLYKSWEKVLVLEETDQHIIVVNHKTIVYELKTKWRSHEPVIFFLYKKKWFNVMATIKNNQVNYYINLASPAIVEEGAVKYIDYDLDIKIKPNKSVQLIDTHEYKKHSEKYNYEKSLMNKIESETNKILEDIKQKRFPIHDGIVFKYLNIYKKWKRQEKIKNEESRKYQKENTNKEI